MTTVYTDTEFEKLIEDLIRVGQEYERLQSLYREQKGRKFVPPIKLS